MTKKEMHKHIFFMTYTDERLSYDDIKSIEKFKSKTIVFFDSERQYDEKGIGFGARGVILFADELREYNARRSAAKIINDKTEEDLNWIVNSVEYDLKPEKIVDYLNRYDVKT